MHTYNGLLIQQVENGPQLVIFAAAAVEIAEWVGKATLLPLALLMLSGTWMGVAPYLRGRRREAGGRQPAPAADHATRAG